MLNPKELEWALNKVLNELREETTMRKVLAEHVTPETGKMFLHCHMDETNIGRGIIWWCGDARCSLRLHAYCRPRTNTFEFFAAVGRIGKFFGRLTQQQASERAQKSIVDLHVREEKLHQAMQKQFQEVTSFLEARPTKTRED